MASRSESPEVIETSVVLGKRNRAPEKTVVKAEVIEDDDDHQPELDEFDNPEDFDPANFSGQLDDDVELDLEDAEIEPEQGEVRWSEERETYPHCPPYHGDVKQIEGRITVIFDKLVEHLTVISNKSDGMQRLSKQAIEIQKFPEPEAQVIALMGDAGAGKSSLISSILDTPYVSREGNFGTSCTCVITEYRKGFPQQKKKFAAKIEFLGSAERTTLLEEHIEQYNYFHFNEDEEWSYEEERDYCSQAKTAEGTFSDLFRGKPGFNNHDEIKTFMQDVFNDDKIVATVAQFEKWCDELASEHSLSTQTELIEADRAFQLTKMLGPYLSSSASWNHKPSLWPIVHKVSIGVQGPRVLENTVIADFPGVSDVNQVRARAGRTYLLSSDYLWIVTPIGRSATDTSVNALLYEYGSRFADHLAIVCTKIDDPMTFQSFLQEYGEDAQSCRQIEMQTKRAKESWSEAKAALRRCTALATRRERGRGVTRRYNIYRSHLHRRLETMVRIRNRKVTALIYREKADRLKKKDVDLVYCVSNKHYSWLKGYKESGQEDAPQLDAVMTGIPKLRQYALTIPTQEIWSTFMKHIKHTSMAFIKALKIWATRTSDDDSESLADVRAKSAETVRAALKAYQQTMEEVAFELLADPMEDSYNGMVEKANVFLQEVRGWHWQTMRAFIRREGIYNSSVVGSVSWNAKMMLSAARFMDDGWDNLISREDEASALAHNTILNALDTILDEVKEPMELLQIPIDHFKGFLEAQKHGVTHAFTNYKEELDKALKVVKYSIEKDDKDGYFAKAMEPMYATAREVRGKGYKNRVMRMIEEYVNQEDADSPFVKMARSATKAVKNKAVKACLTELQDQCLKIFEEIFLQFGCLIDRIPDDDGAVAETKSLLRNYLVEADNEMEAMVKRLNEIEKDPRPPIVEEERAPTPVSTPTPASLKIEPDLQTSSPATIETPSKKRVKIEIKDEDEE